MLLTFCYRFNIKVMIHIEIKSFSWQFMAILLNIYVWQVQQKHNIYIRIYLIISPSIGIRNITLYWSNNIFIVTGIMFSPFLLRYFFLYYNRTTISFLLLSHTVNSYFFRICHKIVTDSCQYARKSAYLRHSFKINIKHFLLTAQIYFFRYTS